MALVVQGDMTGTTFVQYAPVRDDENGTTCNALRRFTKVRACCQ